MEVNTEINLQEKDGVLILSPVRREMRPGDAQLLWAGLRRYHPHLVVTCPITSEKKGYPFEVELPKSLVIRGVVLADQVKNLDWAAREAEFKCHAPHWS